MRLIGWFNLAAVVAGLMVLVIAYYLVPDKSWTTAAITSIVLFALASGFIFYIPTIFTNRHQNRDAVPIASIGPLAFLTGIIPILTVVAFVLALTGNDNFAFATEVLAVGLFIICCLMLRAAADVVSNAESNHSVPSRHIGWQSDIQGISSIVTNQLTKKSLTNLSEKLRYAASDIPGGSPHDNQIDRTIDAIKNQLSSDANANVQELVTQISVFIEQRDIYLRTARNKA